MTIDKKILDTLSEKERKVALSILNELKEKGESETLADLKYADYKKEIKRGSRCNFQKYLFTCTEVSKLFIDYFKYHSYEDTRKYFKLNSHVMLYVVNKLNLKKTGGVNKIKYIWCTNGIENIKVVDTEKIPDNFYRGRTLSKDWCNKISKSNTGKKQSKNTVEKRRLKSLGNKSLTGKVFVHKHDHNKVIDKSELYKYLSQGYTRGNIKTKGIVRDTNFKNKLKRYAINNKEKVLLNIQKGIDTKIKNKSFNISKPEEEFSSYLETLYGKSNVIRQYKEERYPFHCDFYIKSKDLFIELNLHWTHGRKPFNKEDTEDLNKLNEWKKLSNSKKYYSTAINVWTNLDVKKLNYFKKNNLNYIIFYSTKEIESWKIKNK